MVRQFGEGAAALSRYQLLLLTAARGRLFKQIVDLTKTWSESIKRTSDVEAETLRRLADCRSTADAVQIYSDWLTTNVTECMTEGQRFRNACLNFCAEAINAVGSGVTPKFDRDEQGRSKG